MRRTMLKSKVHCATLTGTELEYEGSIAIDADILKAADIAPGEQAHVLNMSNASRIITYVIEAPSGSGVMMLNGPAARLGLKGDKIIVLTYCELDEDEIARHEPRVVFLDDENRQRAKRQS